jgi:hypothetical protein
MIELIESMPFFDEMMAILEGAESDYVLLGFGDRAED